jgi:hypothetical protein
MAEVKGDVWMQRWWPAAAGGGRGGGGVAAAAAVSIRPLGLSLYPVVSGGCDIVLGDRFRPKLAYSPPLLTTSVELGCKKT